MSSTQLTDSASEDRTANQNSVCVYFDGSCPLCRREIALYQRLQARESVNWVDISQAQSSPVTEAIEATGKSQGQLMARFHVQRAGVTLDGARAFVALWHTLPGWRWLAKLSRFPGMLSLMEVSYNAFLPLRPKLQVLANALTADHLPADIVPHLRTDHAGEVGAIWIYRGMLLASRDPVVSAFAKQHLETEKQHLQALEQVLPWPRRTLLRPVWVVAGFLTGALPALVGRKAVFATIQAVETFVEQHYEHQIQRINAMGTHASLEALLVKCQSDEVDHKNDAVQRLSDMQSGPLASSLLANWGRAISVGSSLAVAVTRRI